MVDKKVEETGENPGRKVLRYTCPARSDHDAEDQHTTSTQESHEARERPQTCDAFSNDGARTGEGGEEQSRASDSVREVDFSSSSSSWETTSKLTRLQSLFNLNRKRSKGKGVASYETKKDCAPTGQGTLGNANQRGVHTQQEEPGTSRPRDAFMLQVRSSPLSPYEASARASAFPFRQDPMSAKGDLSLQSMGSSMNKQRQKALGSAPSTSSKRGTSTSSSSFSSFQGDLMPAEGDLSIKRVGDEDTG